MKKLAVGFLLLLSSNLYAGDTYRNGTGTPNDTVHFYGTTGDSLWLKPTAADSIMYHRYYQGTVFESTFVAWATDNIDYGSYRRAFLARRNAADTGHYAIRAIPYNNGNRSTYTFGEATWYRYEVRSDPKGDTVSIFNWTPIDDNDSLIIDISTLANRAKIGDTIQRNASILTTTDNIGINWADITNPTSTQGLSGTQVHVYDTDTTGPSGDSAITARIVKRVVGGGTQSLNGSDSLTVAQKRVAPDWNQIQNPTATAGLSGTQVHVYDTDSSGYVGITNIVTNVGTNAISSTSFTGNSITAAAIANGAIDSATFADDVRANFLNRIIHTGTAAGATTTTLTLAANSFADDEINGNVLYVRSGTGAGQARRIVNFVASTEVATVDSAFTTTPTGAIYFIYPDADRTLLANHPSQGGSAMVVTGDRVALTSTNGPAIDLTGGTNAVALNIASSGALGQGIRVAANSDAVSFESVNGTALAAISSGGKGAFFHAGGNNAGLYLDGAGTEPGLDIRTEGSGPALRAIPGANNVGFLIKGGATSGSAESLSVTAGHGIVFVQAGTNSVGFKGALDTVRNALGVTGTTDSGLVTRIVKRSWGFALNGTDTLTTAQRVVTASLQNLGTGPYTATVYFLDSAAGTAVQGYNVSYRDSVTQTTYTQAMQSDANGKVQANVIGSTTYFVRGSKQLYRFAANADTVLNVASANFTDTVLVVGATVPALGVSGTVTVYAYEVGPDGVGIGGAKVTARLTTTSTGGLIQFAGTDSAKWMNNIPKITFTSAHPDSLGLWRLPLVPPTSLQDTCAFYTITVEGNAGGQQIRKTYRCVRPPNAIGQVWLVRETDPCPSCE